MDDLSERALRVLSLVVEEYIATGEPVGSKTVTEKLGGAVSSATVRNDMAELAAHGLLDQPHTSAGRIPTAPAFRLYIDRLMRRRPLSPDARRAIDERLGAATDPADLLSEASEVLAEATGMAAVASAPESGGVAVRRIELLRLSPRSLALLLMTDGGLLRSRVCRLDAPVGGEALAVLTGALNTAFLNTALTDIGLAQIQGVFPALGEHGLTLAPALTAFYELIRECAALDVHLTGQLNLLRHPDYAPEDARSLLDFLTRPAQLTAMLSALPDGLRVVLGGESRLPPLLNSSVLLAHYLSGGTPAGTLGLIGPLRMDYAAAIPQLEYFAKTVGQLLAKLTEEYNNGE